MHTTDNQGTTERGLVATIRRDTRVAWKMIQMLFGYVVIGGKVRRAVRRAAARGETFYVDDHTRR